MLFSEKFARAVGLICVFWKWCLGRAWWSRTKPLWTGPKTRA